MQEITGAKPVRDANFIALKALSAMHSLGKRIQPGAIPGEGSILRPQDRSRASAQVGFISPLCPRAAPETATISASMQQPADFFCKEFLPEHHRLEAPLSFSF